MTAKVEVIKKGDDLGNGMIVRFGLPSGREILAFGSESIASGDWAQGPTWCYFVRSDSSFALDCGWEKLGGGRLLNMMEEAGVRSSEIKTVLVSHGHEDHDGGLAEFASAAGAEIMAHPIYNILARFYPEKAPPGARPDFPASCWHCQMPASFSDKHCVAYHRKKTSLNVTGITRFGTALFDGAVAWHVPGHAPDAIAVAVANEAILVGDTILPEITPHPTRESFYLKTGFLLKPLFEQADRIYGIRAYLRSLKLLLEIGNSYPDIVVLPAHRLFYQNRWNHLSLKGRVEELLGHHVQRCGDILDLLKSGHRAAEKMAQAYFEPRLLRNYGIYMAINEIVCHCELLAAAGDLVVSDDGQFAATGSTRFESLIESLEPWTDAAAAVGSGKAGPKHP